MIRVSGFHADTAPVEQIPLESLPLFRPLDSCVEASGTARVKNTIPFHRNVLSGRFAMKGGFCGSGAQRRMVIVGKIGKF